MQQGALWKRLGACAMVLALNSCSSAPVEEEPVSAQEWDLRHGGTDGDGCPRHSRRIEGTDGNDVLRGTNGADCILGFGGNDEIHGLNGDDFIVGGDGDDVMYGDNGDDKLVGGHGNDTVFGGNGEDVVLGGGGNDVLDGGNGRDWVAGGACNDNLVGGNGRDAMDGDDGHDRIARGHWEYVNGGDGTDACDGFRCEYPSNQRECTSDADCRHGKHCVLDVGLCVREDAGDDRSCDGVDDDCDGNTDEDFAPSCHHNKVVTCVDGERVKTECTGGQTCSAGACTGGGCGDTDDGNPCTTDGCSGSTPTHTPVPAGTSCSDDDACNGDETCDASGSCTGGTAPTVDDGNPCTDDDCDPSSGVTHTPVASGTSCGDSNACNGSEMCDGAGACASGMPPVVDDGNVCTADACDPSTGVSHVPLREGLSCSDGDACNGDEMCDGNGGCVAGPAPTVDDGNPCTADACDPMLGVTHTPVAAGASCDDADVCNGNETCDGAGSCMPGAAPAVDDGNVCTSDACDPIGGVTHTPVSDGTSCADGDVCNGGESCNAGSCAAGAPLSTDDGNACTADACDPVTGVSHTNLPPNTSCGAGLVCNGAGSCIPAGVCVGRPVGFSCSDGNVCNGMETCNGLGVCNPGVPPVRPPPGC